MAQNAENVSAAKPAFGGAISVAPANTTLPTDATTELAATFKGLGYCSEDGLTDAGIFNAEEVKAWGGDTVMTLENGDGESLKFKLIEVTSVEVLKYVFGDENVSGTLETGIEIKKGGYERPEKVLVVDTILRNDTLKRIVVPKGKIVSVADIVYKDKEALGYEVTVKANKDSAGKRTYEYIKAAANG